MLGWFAGDATPGLLVGASNYEDGSTNSSPARHYDLAAQTVRDILPAQTASAGPMALADVEGTGNLDLFVGGRVVPGRFPEPASSSFFRHNQNGFQFDPVASQAFVGLGLVSGAVWSDLNGDGTPELVLACQGGPIRVFRLDQGHFHEATESLGLGKYLGLWNSVCVGDFDGDGRLDIVAGNWGRNTKYESHLAQPLHFYYGDSDQDGLLEVVEAYFDPELRKIVPSRDWGVLSSAMPFIREQYHNYAEFSTAGVSEFLGEHMDQFKDMIVNTLDSMVFLNRGDHFEARPLPRETQLAPVFGLAVADFDGDGCEDVVASQNFFAVPPPQSRLDGGRGVLLQGDGQGGFAAMPGQNSGIKIYGEGRGLAVGDFDHDGRTDLAAAQNANATLLYRNTGGKPGLRVLLHGPPGNPLGIGAIVRIQYRDGRLGPVREVHAGGGYWSQDAATVVLGLAGEPQFVLVKWPGGTATKTSIPSGARELGIGR